MSRCYNKPELEKLHKNDLSGLGRKAEWGANPREWVTVMSGIAGISQIRWVVHTHLPSLDVVFV